MFFVAHNDKNYPPITMKTSPLRVCKWVGVAVADGTSSSVTPERPHLIRLGKHSDTAIENTKGTVALLSLLCYLNIPTCYSTRVA